MGDDRSQSPLFILVRPRREAFDYGILPFLASNVNPTLFLSNLKNDFRSSLKIDASVLSDKLKVSKDRACFIIETIASILPDGVKLDDRGVVDVDHLILFLYLQNYKRMAPCRINKDSPAVSDVWPSISAFDKCISLDSPRQFLRSNSRHFIPSQADEDIHQLSYLQKNIANMLTLLLEPGEEKNRDSLVSILDRFEHLGILIQFFKDGHEEIPLRQAISFFLNSDENKPNLSDHVTRISEWVLHNIDVSLECSCHKVTEKENGQLNASDGSSNQTRNFVVSSPLPDVVECMSKISVVKKEHDLKGSSVKVMNCYDSVIYLLAPLKYATISGCSDSTVVLGAVGKTVRVEGCERLQIIMAAKRVCVINCRECIYYMGVNERPVFLGDNHKLQVAPYNTFYSQLNEHINQVSLNVNINRWNEPLVLGMTDLHDVSHSAGIDDVEAETPTCIDPQLFAKFVIPDWYRKESKDTPQSIEANPFVLPEKYTNNLMKIDMALDNVQQTFRDTQLAEENKRELIYSLHLHFKEWLYASGNVRQLYCLQDDCRLEQGLAQVRI